jgi:hypothetical protein
MARWGNPGGVEERGMSTLGFPRNLGETDVSTEQRQRGSRKRNLQVPSWTSVTAKRTTDVNGGTDGRGKTEVRKDGRQLSELLIVPQKRVNVSLAEPVEGSGSRYRTTVGVKHDEYSGTRERVNENPADSGACETSSGQIVRLAVPPYRPALALGGVRAHTQRWCPGYRWCDGRGLRAGSTEPPATAARSGQVR